MSVPENLSRRDFLKLGGAGAALLAGGGALAACGASGSAATSTTSKTAQPATPKSGAAGLYAGAAADPQAPAEYESFAGDARRPRVQRSSTRGLVINIVGFLVTAVLGLVAGYYIVSIIKPDSELLKLKFPWSSTAEPSPQSADEPPSRSP